MADRLSDERLAEIEAAHATHCGIACCEGWKHPGCTECDQYELILEVKRLRDLYPPRLGT